MLAVRLHGSRELRLHDEPSPSPGDGEALLRVTAVGLCGSDRHWYRTASIGDAVITRPLVLGHEIAAVVASGRRRGHRVAIDPAVSCGRCVQCATGDENLCPHVRFAGHGETDGGLRELMSWPERLVHDVPDELADEDVALLEPLTVALHAVDLGHLRDGSVAGVFGCGPLGLLIVGVLLATGAATVIATDPLVHRVAAASALGARGIVARGGLEHEEIVDATGGRGVDVAFEVAGDDDAVNAAIAAAVPGARVVLVGIPEDDRTRFAASTARRKGLTLVMSRRARPTYERAIRLATGGHLDLRGLVTTRHRLDEFDPAFASLDARAGLKVIVMPSSD